MGCWASPSFSRFISAVLDSTPTAAGVLMETGRLPGTMSESGACSFTGRSAGRDRSTGKGFDMTVAFTAEVGLGGPEFGVDGGIG
jgi:hypothetical protein